MGGLQSKFEKRKSLKVCNNRNNIIDLHFYIFSFLYEYKWGGIKEIEKGFNSNSEMAWWCGIRSSSRAEKSE